MLPRFRPPVLFNTDDPGGAAPPAPESAAPAPEPAAPAPLNPAPWTADLELTFSDPEIRQQVDAYLRSSIQPRMTQLEQETAPARALYKDLQDDPASTWLAVTSELFGDDVAEQVKDLLAAAPEDLPEPEATAAADLPPEVQELIEERRAAQQAAEFDAAFTALKTETGDEELTKEDFAPFVITADGDLKAAYAGYRKFLDTVKSRYAPAEPAAPPAPAPPNALGTDGTGNPTPPVQKQYASFDEALEDALADVRANRQGPTTVGSV